MEADGAVVTLSASRAAAYYPLVAAALGAELRVMTGVADQFSPAVGVALFGVRKAADLALCPVARAGISKAAVALIRGVEVLIRVKVVVILIGQIGVGSGVGIFQPCPEGLGITAVLAGATAGVERGVAAVRAVPVMLRVNLASADGADLVPTKDRPWICWFIPMIRMRSLLLLT